jgi:beta-galactosidase
MQPPFLYGAQYYRAPTPAPDAWEGDLRRMRELGMTDVKFWVQWRWTHREPEQFHFDDIDRLADLAADNGLRVTLNVIFDVAPLWLFERFPDARQRVADGSAIEAHAVMSRQIGGYPGPCLTHPGAREAREAFLAATVERYAAHPAMGMWDIWNEAKISACPRRRDGLERSVCYCGHCRQGFVAWLRERYGELAELNRVWGRCYDRWEQVEAPVTGQCITDLVDWREYHVDVLTGEASWRLETVHRLDATHHAYLHVVPATGQAWDVARCAADDFALADPCDVFAATCNQEPGSFVQVVSAGRGKVCYNVESHVSFGSINRRQRPVDLPMLLDDHLPQLGAGIKGFLYWQFRSETLGCEAPAWGLVDHAGRDRPTTRAVEEFRARIAPQLDALSVARPPSPAVGVLRSRRNELFHYAIHGTVASLAGAVDTYVNLLYWRSVPLRIVSGEMLRAGELDGLKLLIAPQPVFMDHDEAGALAEWVEAGGTLLAEGDLGAYDATAGRYSPITPGCGLADRLGFRETSATAAHHLAREPEGGPGDLAELDEDTRKAMQAARAAGGPIYPIDLLDGPTLWARDLYGELVGEGLEPLGAFGGPRPSGSVGGPTVAAKDVGAGRVFYAATWLAGAVERGDEGLSSLLDRALDAAGVTPTLAVQVDPPGAPVHLDVLGIEDRPRLVVAINRADQAVDVALRPGEALRLRGVFTDAEFSWPERAHATLPAGFADLLEVV